MVTIYTVIILTDVILRILTAIDLAASLNGQRDDSHGVISSGQQCSPEIVPF